MSHQPPNRYVGSLPPPFANPELLNHSELFKKVVYQVGSCVWVYVGWNLANIIFVAITTGTNQGIVVVDTGEDLKQMKTVWELFHDKDNQDVPDSVKSLPLIGIILTHHHADHVNGTECLMQYLTSYTPDGNLIIGAENLNSEFQQENGLILPLMSCRAMAQYNNLLLNTYPEECAGLNSGIGPIITQSATGYVKPTKTIPLVSNTITTENFGTDFEFQIVYVPSEANSEIAVYLPSENILLSAEVIQDHSFPNLYTLRGANFRDPSNWAAAVDTFMTLFPGATDMVLQHGPPITQGSYEGNTISEILVRYRDAIQFVHDQTLRWAMKGYAKEEIVHLVNLPSDQANFKPWLQEFYGTVKHSVPAVYTGYIGWFDGDPIALSPTPRSEFSARTLSLMGGPAKVLAVASDIFLKANKLQNQEHALKEWQYAAELATLIIRQDPEYDTRYNPEAEKAHHGHQHLQQQTKEGGGCKCSPAKHLLHRLEGDDIWWQARYLKAACFRQMAYRTICANWRGTYLTAAHELEGVDLLSQITNKLRLTSPLAAKIQGVELSLDELSVRLRAEDAENAPLIKLGLRTTDGDSTSPNEYLLILRNCVLFYTPVTENTSTIYGTASVTIVGSTQSINVLLGGDDIGGFESVLNNQHPLYQVAYEPEGADSVQTASQFFSYFEAGRYTKPPNIYVH
jgi:alkyl sulfatase BDS1-like metallo-beta-lactamase superfamily hydrolase